MMPWQQIRNVHAVSGGGDIAEGKNGTVSSEDENVSHNNIIIFP